MVVEVTDSENRHLLVTPPTRDAQYNPQARSDSLNGNGPSYSMEARYPVASRGRVVTGKVVVAALVAEDGSIAQVKAIRGDTLLYNAAIDAVRRWHYKPANQHARGGPITITVNFAMSSN
jgi:TonB family protein